MEFESTNTFDKKRLSQAKRIYRELKEGFAKGSHLSLRYADKLGYLRHVSLEELHALICEFISTLNDISEKYCQYDIHAVESITFFTWGTVTSHVRSLADRLDKLERTERDSDEVLTWYISLLAGCLAARDAFSAFDKVIHDNGFTKFGSKQSLEGVELFCAIIKEPIELESDCLDKIRCSFDDEKLWCNKVTLNKVTTRLFDRMGKISEVSHLLELEDLAALEDYIMDLIHIEHHVNIQYEKLRDILESVLDLIVKINDEVREN